MYALQFTAKQLNRQANKAQKDEKAEKDKLKKVGIPPHSAVERTSTDDGSRGRHSSKAMGRKSPRSTHKTPSASRTSVSIC